jgi:hypothetical protein
MEDPKIELNPHPKMHYAITVTFTDAPGPFDSIRVAAQYEVSNRDCVPERPVSGATILPSKRIELQLQRINDAMYETDVYVDQIEDENYFSKGVCHWSLVSVSAKASRGTMDFVTPLFNPKFFKAAGETRYFSYLSYNDTRARMLNTGNLDRNAYPDPSKTFSVNVVAREIRQ